MKHAVALPLALWVWVIFHGSVLCQRPAVVNLGAVFTFDSVIGRPAKVAMEAAVSDVNSDPRILNGTKLNLITGDAKCNVFIGSIASNFLILLSVFILVIAFCKYYYYFFSNSTMQVILARNNCS